MQMITVQQHIIDEQQKFPHASGEFSFLLSGITLACKIIQAKVRRAGISDILGAAGTENIQGEQQQKLDVFANNAMIENLSTRPSVGILASEENEHPIVVSHPSESAKYGVIFDPLDGSSNIDVNVSVGTTFSIFGLKISKKEVFSCFKVWFRSFNCPYLIVECIFLIKPFIMIYN